MAGWMDLAGLALNAYGAYQQGNAIDDASGANTAAQQAALDFQKKIFETPSYDVYGGKSGYLPDPVTGEMGLRTQLTPEQQAIANALLRGSSSQAGIVEQDASGRAARLPGAISELDVPLDQAQGIVDRDIQRNVQTTVNPLLKQIQSQIQRQGGNMLSNTPERYATAFNEKVLPAMNTGREQGALSLQDTMRKRAQQNEIFYKTGETPTFTNLQQTTPGQANAAASSMTTPTTSPSTAGLVPGLLGGNLQAISASDKSNAMLDKYLDSTNRWLGDK